MATKKVAGTVHWSLPLVASGHEPSAGSRDGPLLFGVEAVQDTVELAPELLLLLLLLLLCRCTILLLLLLLLLLLGLYRWFSSHIRGVQQGPVRIWVVSRWTSSYDWGVERGTMR